MRVLRASADRREPQCPLFGTCGGCQYQHLAYAGQLAWKTRQVGEIYRDIPQAVDCLLDAHPSPVEYGYRSKITPHHPPRRDKGTTPVGFLHHSQRNRVVDVEQCPIATPAINEALTGLRREFAAPAGVGKGKRKNRGATFLLRETMEGVTRDQNAIVTERVGQRVFQFRAGEFFQNNPAILPEFVGYAVDEARDSRGELDVPPRHLVDAYGGVGLFGICAAGHFESVRGVEVSAAAVTLAQSNAVLNQVNNYQSMVGEACAIFAKIATPAQQTVILIDPPRRGCDADFLKQLTDYGPARLVYVSCDPATQARDIRYLLTRGYRLNRLQPFDLFPQTRHIECVATLTRDTAGKAQ